MKTTLSIITAVALSFAAVSAANAADADAVKEGRVLVPQGIFTGR